eukprot:TRINITY_DN2810_c1_g2_i2.p1 TRINITY_DN2810_c1_g2~~TRINITY_DN2810_c1_g2_i2.p1  ORF type:complete len:242 (+),score=14.14 TRINITY_DN2810_c1_g2_i2:144-869(+)
MRLHGLIFAVTLVPLITMIAAYTISLTQHLVPNDHVIPWISSMIDFSPAANIGAFGLSMTSFLLIIFVFTKYRFNTLVIDVNSGIRAKLHTRNNINLAVGIIFGVGLNGLACFPFHVSMIAHILFMNMFFISGAIYVILVTHLDLTIKAAYKRTRILRLCFCIVVVICCIVMTVLSGVYYQEVPTQKLFLDIAASLQVVLATSYFIFFASYYRELTLVTVNFEVKWKEMRTPLLGTVNFHS